MIIIIFLSFFLSNGDIHVSPGDSGTSCGSQSSPCSSIYNAVTSGSSLNNMNILVSNGVYVDSHEVDIEKSVSIIGENRTEVMIYNSYYLSNSFTLKKPISVLALKTLTFNFSKKHENRFDIYLDEGEFVSEDVSWILDTVEVIINQNFIYFDDDKIVVNFTSSSFVGRTGKAVYNSLIKAGRSKTTFAECLFSGFCTTNSGGVVDVADCFCTFINSTFRNISVLFDNGGALYFCDCLEVQVQSCLFENISTYKFGGAIYRTNAFSTSMPFVVNASSFKNCSCTSTAANANGGALAVEKVRKMNIALCWFEHCTAAKGGACWFENVEGEVKGSFFINSTAVDCGGAVYVVATEYLKFKGDVFLSNKAGSLGNDIYRKDFGIGSGSNQNMFSGLCTDQPNNDNFYDEGSAAYENSLLPNCSSCKAEKTCTDGAGGGGTSTQNKYDELPEKKKLDVKKIVWISVAAVVGAGVLALVIVVAVVLICNWRHRKYMEMQRTHDTPAAEIGVAENTSGQDPGAVFWKNQT